MKTKIVAVAGAALAIGATAMFGVAPAFAHHSFAMFDMGKTTTIEGTVQKYEWSNPHSWLFVVAPGPTGATATYGFELSSVGELLRRGWTKTVFMPGSKVKVSFHPVRDGTAAGQLVNAWSDDGKLIGRPAGAGSPGGGGAPGGPPGGPPGGAPGPG